MKPETKVIEMSLGGGGGGGGGGGSGLSDRLGPPNSFATSASIIVLLCVASCSQSFRE